ncbi:MAG: hypothetical protein NWF07_14650, partial [Candidatus Bathyarchaeota archaeon]|nr:hypothetical protein [Candidatus Bathyarchaeota archaeon]
LTITPTQAWDPYTSPAYIYDITANPTSPSPAGTNITLTALTDDDTYLDQETISSSILYQVGYPGWETGQTFVPDENSIREILLWIRPWFTNTEVTITLWTGPREDPDSLLLGTTTPQNTTVGFFKIYTYRFPDAIPLTPGETYYFYPDGDVWVKGCNFYKSSTAELYPPGTKVPENPDWHGDLWFKTYAQRDLEYSYSFDEKTTWTPWSQSNTYKWNTTLLDTGNYAIYAKVKDNTVGGTSETWMPLNYELTPPTIETVITLIQQQIDNQGTANSLISQLTNAQKAIEKGNYKTADNIINAYINYLTAQSGKNIPTDLANLLITIAQNW